MEDGEHCTAHVTDRVRFGVAGKPCVCGEFNSLFIFVSAWEKAFVERWGRTINEAHLISSYAALTMYNCVHEKLKPHLQA